MFKNLVLGSLCWLSRWYPAWVGISESAQCTAFTQSWCHTVDQHSTSGFISRLGCTSLEFSGKGGRKGGKETSIMCMRVLWGTVWHVAGSWLTELCCDGLHLSLKSCTFLLAVNQWWILFGESDLSGEHDLFHFAWWHQIGRNLSFMCVLES